jgi:ABC-2 type transport system permease protein
MNRTFLIARQEFIKYVTRRGFAISILMFPLWIVIVTLVPQWTGGGDTPSTHVFTVVDRTGGAYANALYCAAARQYWQRWMDGATHYADTLADPRKLPPQGIAALLQKDGIEPGDVANLHCGDTPDTDAIESALRRAKKPGVPDFAPTPEDQHLFFIAPPAYLSAAAPANFPAAVRRALAAERAFGFDNTPPLDTVFVIPKDFGRSPNAVAESWTGGRLDPDLRQLAEGALVKAMQFHAIHRVAPQLDDPTILDASVHVRGHDPERGTARNGAVDSVVPIALAIILFVVSVMNSSVLLQGVVEEKSTRMIEVLLSCATAREITTGKLIGVIAVALTTLLIWALALFVLMAIASHDTMALVIASLRATASLQTLPFLLVFFLCGLLIYGSLFLAIGSMANSLADAQSLLGPSMLILMLPNLMISGIMRDPNGSLATTLSWVPIYTPFFMMLRMSSHPPVWQIWGTVALAITTAALMIFWTGRVFARHVLTTERPPSLGALFARFIPKRG